MTLLRSILAVVAGFAITVFIVAASRVLIDPHLPDPVDVRRGAALWPWHLLLIGIQAVAAVVGGYGAAWVAARRRVAHAMMLGATLLVLGAAHAVTHRATEPIGVGLATAGAAAAGAVLGGYLRVRVAGYTAEHEPPHH